MNSMGVGLLLILSVIVPNDGYQCYVGSEEQPQNVSEFSNCTSCVKQLIPRFERSCHMEKCPTVETNFWYCCEAELCNAGTGNSVAILQVILALCFTLINIC
ncbi:unnamed protein product [Calicophoron daubneyi]|uniref:Uncharacterized protein n=1 Tax=Calicophoron daubneyi TaxID=300641 RepID=A0AAV2TVL2_CALDB